MLLVQLNDAQCTQLISISHKLVQLTFLFHTINTPAMAKKSTPSVCRTKRAWPWHCRVRLSSLTAYATFATGRWGGSRNAFARRTAPSGTVSAHSYELRSQSNMFCTAPGVGAAIVVYSHIYLSVILPNSRVIDCTSQCGLSTPIRRASFPSSESLATTSSDPGPIWRTALFIVDLLPGFGHFATSGVRGATYPILIGLPSSSAKPFTIPLRPIGTMRWGIPMPARDQILK